jgi:hypothetical protein
MHEMIHAPPAVWQRVSASLVPGDSPLTVRGKIDLVSIEEGIEGWILDLEAPAKPVRITLFAGDAAIAETASGASRPDVAALLGADATPGFRFSAEALRNLVATQTDLPLRVGLTGSPVEILADTHLPSVQQMIAAHSVQQAGYDLLERLAMLRNAGKALAESPLRTSAAREVGFVEMFAADDTGIVWIQGWMLRDAVLECPAVIVDGCKEPAGLTVTCFERDDLDSQHCGFAGMLHSGWTPTGVTTPLIFINGRELMYLRCANPTRIIKHREFATSLRTLAPRCHTGATSALIRVLDNPESWTPMESQTAMAIERALIVPGFGCIIGGWVLNPLHTAKRFSLRFGTTILGADEDSIVFSARPDLANAAPGCDELLTHAGFVAVLRGPVDVREIDRPVLKIFYEGGLTTRHAIEPAIFRCVGTAASPASILSFYPSLISEPFFEELARALRDAERVQAAAWRFLSMTPCKAAIVCVLSGNRSSAFLLSEQLRVHCADQKAVGVLLISDQGAIRSDALALRASLVRESAIACSVVAAQRPTQALYALDSMLAQLNCDRFVFLGPGIVLTDSGWCAAFDYLKDTEPCGRFFGIDDPSTEAEETVDSAYTAAAFGWTRQALSGWLESAPAILGGYAGDNGLGRESFAAQPGAAWFTWSLDGTAFVQAVNCVAP